MGAALLLRERPGVPRNEHVLKHAGRIRDASDRALRLISDLLDWGRLEEGRLPLEVRDEESSALLAEAVDSIRTLAENHQLPSRWTCPASCRGCGAIGRGCSRCSATCWATR